MKKNIAIITGVLILTLVLANVSALSVAGFNIQLKQKNPADWSIVKKGAYGQALLWNGNKAQGIGMKLKPFTDYTLIYYGYGVNNDKWPYATCIASATTDKRGNMKTAPATFDYSGFVSDAKAQKFWIIKSSDVDCTSHTMTAWNPSDYLFETRTI